MRGFGDHHFEPADHNPADDPGSCEIEGCENYGENLVDGKWICNTHYNAFVLGFEVAKGIGNGLRQVIKEAKEAWQAYNQVASLKVDDLDIAALEDMEPAIGDKIYVDECVM